MPLYICTACGTQYPESAQAPAQCVICEEERQYVPPRGQTWTTFEALRAGYRPGRGELVVLDHWLASRGTKNKKADE